MIGEFAVTCDIVRDMSRQFYNPSKAISYGAPLTAVISMRSYGKTYGFTKAAIKDWMRDKSQFVYVRRYDTELKTSAPKIFDDIAAHDEFPGYEFKMQGYTGLVRKKTPDDSAKWEEICHCIPLSKQASYKGVAFPRVKKIIFDEYIRVLKTPPGYLRDDMGALFDLYKTISRDRENAHMYLLGNACDLTNPLFLFLGRELKGEPKDGFSWYRNKTVLVEYAKNKQFADEERQTVVGRLVDGTQYAGVMIDAKFANAGEEFIAAKPSRARYLYGFDWQGKRFGCWVDERNGYYYISRKLPKDADSPKYHLFALSAEDMRPNMYMIKRADPFIKNLQRLYTIGVCFFDSPATREQWLKMTGLIGYR